jgi:hypothetical protein
MTHAQNGLYFREWSTARRALRKQGLSPKECDARRHQVHVEELGEDKSHLAFTEDDFDAVLGGFWKISYPWDLARQLRQLNMRKTRMLYRIRQIASESYVQGIIDRMDARRSESPPLLNHSTSQPDDAWERERERGERPKRHLDDLDIPDLKNVLVALRQDKRRGEPGWQAVLEKRKQKRAAEKARELAPF